MNIAARLEELALNKGPVNLAVVTLVASFMLLMSSTIVGVDSIIDKRYPIPKQVGFVYAPNWFIVYMVLYPLYVVFFCILVGQCRAAISGFVADGTITGKDGQTLDLEQFFKAWKATLDSVSFALVALLIAVAAQTAREWYQFSYLPIMTNTLNDAPLDWSSFAAIYTGEVDPIANLVFSGVAYAYMGSALFIFLAVMVYGAAYCWFLYRLSERNGPFRLTYRNKSFIERLAGIVLCIYSCSLLGVIAAYAMRLQTEYLHSDFGDVRDLVFAYDLGRVTSMLWPTVGSESAGRTLWGTASNFTSYGVVIYSALLLALSMVLLYETFQRARSYILEKATREEWREAQRFTWDDDLLAQIRDATFLKSVVPRAVPLLVVFLLAMIACVQIGYGTLMVVMLGGVVTQLIAGRRIAMPDVEPLIRNLPPVSPRRELSPMKTENVEILVDLLARQSRVRGGREYFRNLVARANIPDEFKLQIEDVWRGDAKANARELVRWADEQGGNPTDPKTTTLGAILLPELREVGIDKAAIIVAVIVVEKLIRDRNRLADLKARFQVPDQTPAGTAVPIGPEIEWNGPEDHVDLQGYFTAQPDFLDVGFLINAIIKAASVCLVDVVGIGSKGTGILIDHSLVLTNYHVLAPSPEYDLLEAARSTHVHFGVFSDTAQPTVSVTLDADEPVVAHSSVLQLDFVLLKIVWPTGVAPRTPVMPSAELPRLKAPLHLLHHPSGGEMKLSISSNGVTFADPESGRLQYITKAANGSSGAPCFDDDWRLVGLHHAERARPFGTVREGILMQNIYQTIKANPESTVLSE